VLAGRYRVARVVSAGANTVLIDAIDLETEGQVTVKVVRPELARDSEFRHKFGRLAEISQALTHPNIASVQDWGEVELGGESTVFWTVDALGGGSLRDLLDRGRLLEPGQALVMGLEACRALDAAHQKGLFHTELTPSKLVFGVDRRLRVVDFGMARLLAEPAWAEPAAVPTHVARYVSPEQALGLKIDSKTDVYALALVMLEAVTGQVPFAADSTVATLAGRVDKLMPVSADLGPLASVLERAGRPESADRFTAAEFGRALVQVASKLPKPEPIPVLATGSFDTTAMRRPTDPTGGVERPAPVAGLAHVDETGAATPAPAADVEPAGADDVVADDELSVDDLGIDEVAGTDAVLLPVEEGGVDAVDDGVDADDVDEADGVPADVFDPADVDGADPAADDASDDDTSDDDAPDDDAPDAGAVDDPGIDDADLLPTEAFDVLASTALPLDSTAENATETMPVAAASGKGSVATIATPVVVDLPPDDMAGSGSLLYDDQPSKQRRGPLVLLVVVLLAGLGALGYAGSLLLQAKSFEVPVLAGVPQDEALNQIVGNDWEITTIGERSDTFPEPDTIIRTVPGPGIELEEGAAFTIVLSEGPEFRTLPEFADLPAEVATAQLADLQLATVEAPERQFSETVAAGNVISWRVQGDADGSMQAGADILPGETIELSVSQGPEPRIVPDFTGIAVADATAVADESRLLVAQGDDVFSDVVPVGGIVGQVPAAGTEIERDGTITVQVSKGPDVVPFPELEGLQFSDAQTLLLETGFLVGDLLGSTDGNFVEATIGGVEVVAGTEFPRGQPVDLIFL